jgi:hypothetical protein
MKLIHCLLLSLAVLTAGSTRAQQAAPTQSAIPQSSPPLTKFDLAFPGGTPGDLVAAIQKAMGRPLNAIIAPEDANRRLPALKMSGVNVEQLFSALTAATLRSVNWHGAYSEMQLGFRSQEQPSDNAVWFFWVRQPPAPPSVSRFFLLTPYLEQGLTVDDITTAVRTAWKMQGDLNDATISYHKETNLLIAAGSPTSLDVIRLALEALEPKRSPMTTKSVEKSP